MKKIKIDLNDILVNVYNKIAEWHNNDGSKEGLKSISHEIIEFVGDKILSPIDLDHSIDLDLDRETREKLNKVKKEME